MRIGIDACCWANKRGFGRFTRELLNALVSLDQKNDYLFFIDQDTALKSKFPERVKIAAVPTLVPPTKAASSSGRRSARDLWRLSREVMRHELDILFFPAVYSYFPVWTRARIIVTIHDLIADSYPGLVFPDKKLSLFWKLKQSLAIKQADLILTVSEYSRSQIIDYFKIAETRVRAVSEAPEKNFIPVADDKKMLKVLGQHHLNPENRFLLYVGGISPHKNLGTLIKVYSRLIQNPGYSDLLLILVGDYKEDSFHSSYPALKKQIGRLGLNKRIIFTGFIPDSELVYFYNRARLLVFPSFQEGFGLPAVEAMTCGTPVAASRTGSLPEILGEAGTYFEPDDSGEMLKVIKNILSDNLLREKIREQGLIRAKQFTWEKAAKDTLRIFEELNS